MKIKILAIENKETVYYTIEDEKKPNLYEIPLTLKMVEVANDKCTITHIGYATIGTEMLNTIAQFHKYCGVELKTPDLFKIARDPDQAPFVKRVYDARRLGPNESYTFIPTFSNN